MSVATLIELIQILSGLGAISNAAINIRNDLEKRKPDDPAPVEHLAAIKALIASNGVWDTSTPEGFIQGTLGK